MHSVAATEKAEAHPLRARSATRKSAFEAGRRPANNAVIANAKPAYPSSSNSPCIGV